MVSVSFMGQANHGTRTMTNFVPPFPQVTFQITGIVPKAHGSVTKIYMFSQAILISDQQITSGLKPISLDKIIESVKE